MDFDEISLMNDSILDLYIMLRGYKADVQAELLKRCNLAIVKNANVLDIYIYL